MKIIISNKEVETKVLSPLTPLFNKIFLSVDKEDDIYDDVIKNITEKNIENIFKVINCRKVTKPIPIKFLIFICNYLFY